MDANQNLFDRFGGIRPMAEALGEAPSTVQSWKAVGRIPATKQPGVLAAAGRLGIAITTDDVVFPMGREDAPGETTLSANNGGEIISPEREAGPGHPFLPSSATSSPTTERPLPSWASPACSDGEADAA
jgi:hypothetical protein